MSKFFFLIHVLFVLHNCKNNSANHSRRIEFVSDTSNLGIGKKRIIEFVNGNSNKEVISSEGLMKKKISVAIGTGLPNSSSEKIFFRDLICFCFWVIILGTFFYRTMA